MKPRDFLDVADALCTGVNEAEWRSAVSRAYYAVFHAARLLMRVCGFAVPEADLAHAYRWLRLANCGHTDIANTGNHLKSLRQVRNSADYDLDRPLEHADAIGYVEVAETVLALLETVPSEPHIMTRITETMRVYERDILRQVTWHG
jgi:uncharacterized protein (UPF0332 family)